MELSRKTLCGVCTAEMSRGTYKGNDKNTYVFNVCSACDRVSGNVLAVDGVTGSGDQRPLALGLWVTLTKTQLKKHYKKIGD